jgi:hypothetical protein
MAEETPAVRPSQQAATPTPNVRWDDAQMRTSYANACNVVSTREEVVLFFGINQGLRGGDEIVVQLGERIMLNPHAAKRLHILLTNVLREHEARFGTIDVEVRRARQAEGAGASG